MIIICTSDDTRDSRRNVGFLDHGRDEIFQLLDLTHPAININPEELAAKAITALEQAAYGSHPGLEAGYVSGRLERLIALCNLASQEKITLQSKEIYA